MAELKIVCISDTHMRHQSLNVPDGDMVIHAGDCTVMGTLPELVSFSNWFSKLPHKHKIMISGNHDFIFERDNGLARGSLHESIVYLQDSMVTLNNGIKIWGSPWQPWYGGWAFNLNRGEELKRKWDLIPDDIDILVTHGPQHGILDFTDSGEHAGCEELKIAVERVKPRLHVCGHIHEGYGIKTGSETTSVNASIMDDMFMPRNLPQVITIDV